MRLPLLHGAGEQPLHEVALEREEDDERDRERHEGRGRDQLDVGAELPHLREDRDGDRLRVAPEGQRHEQVVPDPEELEDRERGDRGQPERQDQPEEDPELGRAVDPRRLEQVLGYPDEEVPEQEDREGQPERRVEEDEPEHGVEEPEVVVEGKDRDQRHLDRHDEERDDAEEEPVAPRKLEPGEGVTGERRDEDREDRPADGNPERRPDRRRDRLVVEDVAVVLERGLARLRQDLPPADSPDLGRVDQRGEEEADRRDEPEHADEREEEVHRGPSEEANDPRGDRLVEDDRLFLRFRGSRHLDLPPEAADVDEQDGDHEQEEEDRDRRPEPVVVLAERRAPHRERDHVGVVLNRARRDRDHDVEDLQDVDQHRDEDDGEDRCEQRDRDPPEHLPLVGSVRARRLEQVARNRCEPGRDHDHRETRPHPRVGDHHRRKDQAGAEPRDACIGSLEGFRADRGAIGPRLDVLEPERAVRLRRRVGDLASTVVAELDGHSRQPELSFLEPAGCAAARLEVSPDDAGDAAGQRPPARLPARRPLERRPLGSPSGRAAPRRPAGSRPSARTLPRARLAEPRSTLSRWRARRRARLRPSRPRSRH